MSAKADEFFDCVFVELALKGLITLIFFSLNDWPTVGAWRVKVLNSIKPNEKETCKFCAGDILMICKISKQGLEKFDMGL